MNRSLVFTLLSSVLVSACGEAENTAAAPADAGPAAGQAAPSTSPAPAPKRERGGTITIGTDTWNIVPSTQCSVYPGNVVAIAGHAEGVRKLEIVIDHDPSGLKGVRLGSESGSDGWYSVSGSIEFEIDGKRVSGSGTFSARLGGGGETASGNFVVDC